MPGGRPRLPGTEEERAQRRRDRVRRNVRRYRQRHRQAEYDSPTVDTSSAAQLPLSEANLCSRRGRPSDGAQSTTFGLAEPEKFKSNLYLKWLSQHFPFRLSFGPTYADAFFATATNRLSLKRPATKDCLSLDMSCGSWVRQVYNNVPAENTERQLAAELLLGAALRKLQDLRKDFNFRTAILEVHTDTLIEVGQIIRFQMNGARKPQFDSLAGSIMAFAVAELLAHSSWERFIFHIQGAGAIFEAMGPDALRSRSSRKCFNGYRAMALPFALMNRQSSFAGKTEWLGLPCPGTKDDYSVRSSALMDILYPVPAIMQAFDGSDAEDYGLAEDQLERALAIRSALESWMQTICPENPWRCMQTPATEFSQGVSPFPTDCMANLLIAYCGANVVVSELCADIVRRMDISSHEYIPQAPIEFARQTENWINKTCWSLQVLSDTCPHGVGKLNCLFSLHVSLKACAKLTMWNINTSAMSEWCQRLGAHFQTNGFPLFPGWVGDLG